MMKFSKNGLKPHEKRVLLNKNGDFLDFYEPNK